MDQILVLAQKLKSQNVELAKLKHSNIDQKKLFLIAYAYYLLSLNNQNTRKQYKTVIDHFIRFMASTQDTNPLNATGIDVTLWRDDLLRTGGVAGYVNDTSRCVPHEKSSVHNKTSILSAFYKFLQKPNINGSDPLMLYNPVDALQTRFKIEKFGRSKKISIEVLKRIMDKINTATIKGLRDFVLLYGFFITGRRNAEWTSLRWDQLNFNTTPPTYTCTRKGEKHTVDELPEKLHTKLFEYLKLRWGENFQEKLQPDTYLFTALPGRGGLRQKLNENNPLTERSMLRILKNYAKHANISPDKITIHSLRHLHAESYLQAGASVEEIRARLRHKSLATTQNYISSINNEKNRLASTLDEMLDIDD